MYLLHGKLTAKPAYENELADILITASKLVEKTKGCKLYAIGKDLNEPNAVYVTEIWDSKEDHDRSLEQEDVRELIMKAMPILDGTPSKGQEIELLGGAGI